MEIEDIGLTEEEMKEAFDGDFGEVYFDHQPTADEILLIKLKLVANTATDKAIMKIVADVDNILINPKRINHRISEISEYLEALKDMVEGEK